jgi:hypothetical protein
MSGDPIDNATTMRGDLIGGSTANFGQLNISGPSHFGTFIAYLSTIILTFDRQHQQLQPQE